MTRRRLILVFVAVFIVGFAILLPLRLVLPEAALQRLGIGAGEVRGPAWDARFDDAHWQGRRLGNARVRLQFWPLLAGRQQIAVATERLTGTLIRGTRDGVAGLDGSLVLDALQDWPGVDAQLRLEKASVIFADGRCIRAEGTVEAELALPPALAHGPALVLGGRPACEDRAVLLRLLPLGETASPLAGLQVDLRLDADGRFQVQALVAGANPAIVAALQGAGFQVGPGGPARIASGSIVTIP